MAHFAVIAPPLTGHYAPLSQLARELLGRGHQVTFLHHPDAEPLVQADGARFQAIGTEAEPVSRWTVPMAKIRGLLGLSGVLDGMVRFTDMFCREAPDAIRRIGADAMICDQLEPAGALVAEHLGLPFASIAVTVPVNREDSIPPPYVGWRFEPSDKGAARNRGGWRVTDLLLRKLGTAIERNSRRLGLTPRRRIEDCLSPTLQISQMIERLDFPRTELPPAFHYVGPFRSEVAGGLLPPPGDPRPLIYCTLGTLQGQRTALFRKVAIACARLDLRLLIARGRMSAAKPLGTLPGDAFVYDWVDQEAVLRQANVVVCHGGMNTVLAALASGLPMVVMPLAFEQGAIAARLQQAGVAKALSFRASARSIARAIEEVRGDPAFRARARALQREILAGGGAARAADLIEQMPAVCAPRAAATTGRGARDDVRGGSRSESSSAANQAS